MRRAYADVQEVSKRLGVWRGFYGKIRCTSSRWWRGCLAVSPARENSRGLIASSCLSKTISFELLRALRSALQHDQLKHATERHVEERPDHCTTSRVREGEGIEPPKPTAQTANRVSEPHGTRTKLQPLLIRSPVAAAGHQRRVIYGTHRPPARVLTELRHD